jgi:hypothetical protein
MRMCFNCDAQACRLGVYHQTVDASLSSCPEFSGVRWKEIITMKTILFAAAAVSCLFAAPSFAAPVNAGNSFQMAQVDINIGARRPGVVVRERRPAVVVHERNRCRVVETRTRRPNGTIVIRKERRC